MTVIGQADINIRANTSGFARDVSRGLGGSFRQVAGISAAISAALGVGAIVKSIGTIGIAYQDSINTFSAVADRAQLRAAGGLKAVRDQATALGNDLKLPNVSAAGAAQAMTELAKAGLSVKDSLAAGRGTLQLAIAGNLDEASAATIAANALNTFHLAGSQASNVANILANAANVSSGEVGDFAQGLAQAGLVANGAGLSIQETAGALAFFANNGLKGSDAGTAFKTMLQRLTPQTKQQEAAMKALHLKFTDATGAFLPLDKVAQTLHSHLGNLTQSARASALQVIFGTDAVRAARLLYDAGGKGIDRYTKAVDKGGGAARIAAAKSKGLGGALRGLQSQAETMAVSIFQRVSPPLNHLVRAFSRDLPGALHTAGEFIHRIVDQFGPPITRAAVSIATTFRDLFIGKVVPILRMLGHYLTDFVIPVFKGLAQFIVQRVVPAISSILAPALDGLRSYIHSVTGALQAHRGQFVALFKVIRTVAGFILRVLAPVIGAVLKTAFVVAGKVMGIQIRLLGELIGAGRHVGHFFSTTFPNAVKSMAGFVVGLFHHLVDVWFSVVGAIVHGGASAFGWLPGVGGKLKDAAGKFDDFRSSVDASLSALADDAGAEGTRAGTGFGTGFFNAVANAISGIGDVFNPKVNPKLDPGHPGVGDAAANSLKKSAKDAGTKAGPEFGTQGFNIGKIMGDSVGKGLSSVASHAINAAKQLAQKVAEQFKALKESADQLATSIADAVRSSADITSLTQTDSLGTTFGPTVGSIKTFLADKLKAARTFRRQLEAEERKGLSTALAQQFAAAGPEQAGATVAALAHASRRDLERISRQNARISKVGTGLGRDVAQSVFGADLREARADRRRANELLGRILRQLRDKSLSDKDARTLLKAFRDAIRHLEVTTDTGKQDHKQGQAVMAG